MAVFAAIPLPALLLEDDDLVAPGLFHHFGKNGRLIEGGGADRGLLAGLTDHQHVAEFHVLARLAGQLFDDNNVVGGDPVLFPAGADDCEHGSPVQ